MAVGFVPSAEHALPCKDSKLLVADPQATPARKGLQAYHEFTHWRGATGRERLQQAERRLDLGGPCLPAPIASSMHLLSKVESTSQACSRGQMDIMFGVYMHSPTFPYSDLAYGNTVWLLV